MRFCFRQVLSQALEHTDGQIATAQDFLLEGKENPRSTQGFESLPFARATRLFENRAAACNFLYSSLTACFGASLANAQASGPCSEQTLAGTYTVNNNCTGAAEIDFTDGSPPLHLHFVLAKRGNEIRDVVSNPGTAITAIGSKLTRSSEGR
jgi:hypothetical protein